MIFREMEIKDYEKVVAFWRESEGLCLRDADSEAGICKYLLRNPGLSFVVNIGEIIIGTIMSGHDGKRGYIQHLAVAPEYRKQGVATKLLNICLGALRSEGIVKSHIHVLNSNDLGTIFWENRGWYNRHDISVFSFINGNNKNA